MLRSLTRFLAVVLVLAAAGTVAYVWWRGSSQSAQIAKLEAEKKVLQEVITRLTTERRVAEVIVTDQHEDGGDLVLTLLFVEYGRDGRALPPRSFTVRGANVHFDAMVIKFDPQFVKEGDPLRGSSIALFTKVYGDKQAPASGSDVDPPNTIPDIYRGQNAQVSDFEQGLWRDFWKLADDEAAAKARGVRTLMGQGVWEPLKKNVLYTLTLEANGGLNLTREPLKEIYQRAFEAAGSK